MQRGTWFVERCFSDKPRVVIRHLGVSPRISSCSSGETLAKTPSINAGGDRSKCLCHALSWRERPEGCLPQGLGMTPTASLCTPILVNPWLDERVVAVRKELNFFAQRRYHAQLVRGSLWNARLGAGTARIVLQLSVGSGARVLVAECDYF